MSNVLTYLQSKLYDYQFEGLLALISYFEQGNDGNPLLCFPTGTGKSFVNAGIAVYAVATYPSTRILFLTHVKKLIEQNHEKIIELWPNAPTGIYSAGLDSRDTVQPLLFGGIASVVNNIDAFGHRDIVIVDEAHLISSNDSSMYQTVLKRLTEINPKLKVIGLTATPYRCGQGMLTEGKGALFTDIAFDLTGVNPFNRFVVEKRLAPVVPKVTDIEIDTSCVRVVKGEFASNQLDEQTDKVLYQALKEAVEKGHDRNCWLVFCSGIKPSEHAAEILQSFGIAAAAVHSKLSDDECDKRFEAFIKGELRAIVGNNKFTTGFDHPPIDMIVMLRPTMSPGLWVQMLGRGTRPYDYNNPQQRRVGFEYAKSNCLVLDFAGNARRLGPINDPKIPRKKGDKTGDIPIKLCEAVHDGVKCGTYNHASARYCGGKPYPNEEGCGAEFIFKNKLLTTAGTDELMRGDMPTIETFEVSKVLYHKHEKMGSPPSLKVSYYVGLQRYTEYQCFEHKGYAKTRAANWWRMRHSSEPPATVDEALIYVSQLRMPKSIRVRTDLHFPEILSADW